MADEAPAVRRFLLRVMQWLSGPQEQRVAEPIDQRAWIVGAVVIGLVILLLVWFAPEFRRYDNNSMPPLEERRPAPFAEAGLSGAVPLLAGEPGHS